VTDNIPESLEPANPAAAAVTRAIAVGTAMLTSCIS